ncbi:acyl carrier protein [Streptomyces sp. SID335]|uniref:Acyl carrier protein n=2 Tax=Streptomyces TaxID=1883 RepID=A0A5P2BLB7_STRVZ|nr:acyl carrier protein [Streptomyces sp. SID335]MYZ17388.1 acyl carrier protein [Streptomyces sp. SID337]NDZ90343.1 acyl carrier protein [Streptomyces sp. SID10115]NEA01709.1 acyl carrier protein [Streptomyces sp. SID10116]NEB44055.1 acyl carrier protein [Streptomyces sp. SID339]QES31173.1 acyl carrier protein [Streptomyces venezuelae]
MKKNFGVRLDDVSSDVPLYQLAIDSLALEELLLLIEDECAIDLADQTLSSRDTVATLMSVVRQKAAAE